METHSKIKNSSKKSVAVLGATGPVGQKVITMLKDHPYFEVTEVAASKESAGHIYGERVQWKNEIELPSNIAKMKIKNLLDVESHFVISTLPKR